MTEECSICLGDLKNKIITLPLCGHSFHKPCINKWLNVTPMCPLCKSFVNLKYVIFRNNFKTFFNKNYLYINRDYISFFNKNIYLKNIKKIYIANNKIIIITTEKEEYVFYTYYKNSISMYSLLVKLINSN